MTILWGYVLTFGWVFFILILSTVLKKAFGLQDEHSRKVVHVGVSFAWVPMYLCFGTTWHLLIPPFAFVILNYISYKKDIFAAMERQNKDSASLGTVYYPVSMMVMALFSMADERFLIPFGIGMFCMAFGDGFAPIFGKIEKGNKRFCNGKRSLYGSLSVFALCFLVVLIMSLIFTASYRWYEMILIALTAMVMEFIGMKGFDNLTLPIGSCLIAWLLLLV